MNKAAFKSSKWPSLYASLGKRIQTAKSIDELPSADEIKEFAKLPAKIYGRGSEAYIWTILLTNELIEKYERKKKKIDSVETVLPNIDSILDILREDKEEGEGEDTEEEEIGCQLPRPEGRGL